MIFRTVITCVRAVSLAAFLALLAVAQGCSKDGEAMMLPADAAPLVIAGANGDVSLSVEIADDAREQERGLMYRARLADGHGMLFILEKTREANFWMKNTPSALDLIFVAEDGRIVTIKRGEALSQAIISSEADVRFVLEIADGEAKRLGLAAGDELRHPAIAAISGQKPAGN